LKPVAITVPDPLLEQMDKRAEELDLNRSQYVRRLVREDFAKEEERKGEVAP